MEEQEVFIPIQIKTSQAFSYNLAKRPEFFEVYFNGEQKRDFSELHKITFSESNLSSTEIFDISKLLKDLPDFQLKASVKSPSEYLAGLVQQVSESNTEAFQVLQADFEGQKLKFLWDLSEGVHAETIDLLALEKQIDFFRGLTESTIETPLKNTGDSSGKVDDSLMEGIFQWKHKETVFDQLRLTQEEQDKYSNILVLLNQGLQDTTLAQVPK